MDDFLRRLLLALDCRSMPISWDGYTNCAFRRRHVAAEAAKGYGGVAASPLHKR